jgi:tetratricopeptide (TPR) repeat protein
MIGRQSALERCEAAIARLGEGQGGLLLVTGEAGIGKTRLVEEVQASALRNGLAWLQGHTLSFGRSISYWPFLEILQQDAGIGTDDGEEERLAKLAARTGSLLEDQTPEVLPYLASMLGLPVPEELAERVSHLDSEAMGRQLYRASRLYFARLARERPVVVVFEDVHWLDGSSAALLEHLLPLTAEVPLLVCCVARPEVESAITRLQELARGEYAERSREIRLKPLSSAESTTLASQLINGTDLPATLRKAILAKAEGNPFFVEEIVQSLIDLGGLVRDEVSGGYRVTDQAVSIAIPDTLLGVIMARVDRLDDDLKQVLRLAAVIGRSFFYRLLAAITEAERELDASLAGLQARELVLEKAREPELEYIFKHALVQEATYASIVKRRRRELHRQVAASIESLFADRLEDFYSLLAYHYTKAEDWEKAQEYLFKAADQAGKLAADAEALDHYEQAMQAYSLAFGEKWDPLQRAAVEHKMGDALYRRGEHERAREHLFRALGLLGRPFPQTPGATRRAIVAQVLRQLGHRVFPFWRRSASGRSAGTVEERFWIYHSLTFMDAGADQSQLLLALLLALNDVESAALGWPTAAAFAGLGYACDFVPLRRVSRFYHRRALRLAEQAQEPFALATVCWLMGFHEYWATGDWAKARDYDRRAADGFQALGRFREWGTSMIEAVNVMVDEGRLAEALPLCERIVALAEEAGDPVVVGWGLCRVGNIRSIKGDHEQAEEALRRGTDLLLRALQPADAVSGFGWLAQCLLRRGRSEKALAILGEQRERIRRYGISGYFLRGCNTARATLSLLEAETRQRPERTVALREAKAAGRDLQRTARADICGAVPAARTRGSYEWLRGRHRKAEAWWRRSLSMADRLGARYEGALTELEIGRRLDDRSALERAKAAFETIGAEHDLAQTRELLRQAEIPDALVS